MRKRDQKGSVNIFIIVAVIIILFVAGWYLLKGKGTAPTMYPNQSTTTSSNQAIQSDTDLQNASRDLDNTNVDTTIDPQLNQNDIDAQTFAPRIRLKNGTSLNWAGYAVETSLINPQNNAVSNVKGSWIVPKVTCPTAASNSYSATWIGIDGYSDNTVQQTGTEQDCIDGQPRYHAWYEMYPKPSFQVNLPVKAGDTMSAEVSYVGKNKFVLTLTNASTGQTFTTTQKSNALRQSAEWITEAPWSGGTLPLADFGTQYFTSAGLTLNGQSGTINSVGQYDAITMTDSSGNPKATPSALSGEGSSFSITWNAN